jgi:PAS domain S-box-containing protein
MSGQTASPNLLETQMDSMTERSAIKNAQRATLNILEDFAAEKCELQGGQRATLNILEDFDAEKKRMAGAERAVLNILEDFASDKSQLEEFQHSFLNILDDFSREKKQFESTQRAVLNILEDFEGEKANVELANEQLQKEMKDRKQAEDAVKGSEQRLNLVLDSANMGIWELNLKNDTSIRSLKHDQIFGFQSLQSEWGAEIFLTHVVPEDRNLVKKKFEEAFLTSKLYLECRILWPDKSVHWINALGTAFRDGNGKPVFMMGTVQEITDRKLAEDEIQRTNRELRAANKELEAFSYSVSHDLRTPLRSIDGFSQALLEDYANKLDATALDHLRRVRSAAQRMAALIDDMLNLSRVTRCELHREKLDLSAMAKLIAAELQQAEPGRRVEFVIEVGLTAVGDPHLLRAAMENLIHNSWKYTSGHPSARIEFGRSDEKERPSFFVRDDGAGFDPRYADRLFGAFQRLHTTKEFPGTGVGLATVQRIIHRHGGEIWAEAEVEKGATFYFTL